MSIFVRSRPWPQTHQPGPAAMLHCLGEPLKSTIHRSLRIFSECVQHISGLRPNIAVQICRKKLAVWLTKSVHLHPESAEDGKIRFGVLNPVFDTKPKALTADDYGH